MLFRSVQNRNRPVLSVGPHRLHDRPAIHDRAGCQSIPDIFPLVPLDAGHGAHPAFRDEVPQNGVRTRAGENTGGYYVSHYLPTERGWSLGLSDTGMMAARA